MKPGACPERSGEPASDQPESRTGLRYQRIHRHQGMAPQSPALRTAVKQAHGVAASAAVIQNRWLSWARGTLPAQAEMPRKGAIMVFVVDVEKRPLAPCHPARARRLLAQGKAAERRRYPFTIILKRAVPDAQLQPPPLRLKLDPGSRTSRLALGNDASAQVGSATALRDRVQQVH